MINFLPDFMTKETTLILPLLIFHTIIVIYHIRSCTSLYFTTHTLRLSHNSQVVLRLSHNSQVVLRLSHNSHSTLESQLTLYAWVTTHTLRLSHNSHSTLESQLTLYAWVPTHTLRLRHNSHSTLESQLTLYAWVTTHALRLRLQLVFTCFTTSPYSE
jgi:hypothetical protein